MIDQIIRNLSEKDFNLLKGNLLKTNADKSFQLAMYYREGGEDDQEIRKRIRCNAGAFYTIKSRLTDKMQEILFQNAEDDRIHLMKNVAAVPSIPFTLPPSTSVFLLNKIRDELKRYDMPAAHVSVLQALKKINRRNETYYTLLQQYHKNVAYALALDKMEDILGDFIYAVDRHHSRSETISQAQFNIYQKEALNISRINASHRLDFLYNIIQLSYHIYITQETEPEDQEMQIDEKLIEMQRMCESYNDDPFYAHHSVVIPVLLYCHYQHLGQKKTSQKSLLALLEKNLNLANFYPVISSSYFIRILLSDPVSGIDLGIMKKMYELTGNVEDISDIHALHTVFLLKFWYFCINNDMIAAASLASKMLNDPRIRKKLLIETEVKLLAAYSFLFTDRTDQAESIVRSVYRKLKEEPSDPFWDKAIALCRVLRNYAEGKNTLQDQTQILITSTTDRSSKLFLPFSSQNQFVR